MGFWVGIKKALNSTVGTSDFQSLDKIIKSQRTYTVSDETLVTLISNKSISATTTKTKLSNASFTSLVNGTLRIKSIIGINVYDNSVYAYFEIYKNGASYMSGSVNHSYYGGSSGGTNYVSKVISIDCPIEKDSTYTFYFYKNSDAGSVTLSNLELCGKITDLSMMKYTLY